MFFELIAAIVAGFVGGGAALIVNRFSGGALPRWSTPVAAGIAMIGFGIWTEYTWYDRTIAPFPETVVVTDTQQSSAPWRPWTYIWPITTRFVALDLGSIRSNAGMPEQHMADLVLFGRWQPSQVVPMIYDCAGARSAPLFDSVQFDADGAATNADWRAVPEDDPTLETLCKEGSR